jgi:hypothetical protein
MKRREVLKKLREAAGNAGVEYEESEGANHTKVRVGTKKSTIGRHNEVPEISAKQFYKQYEEVLGEGWWK